MLMNDTITTTELLALLVRSGKKLLAAALVFAALLGCFQLYSQSRASQEAIADRKTEEYRLKLAELEKTVQRESQAIQAKQTYLENSLLMQLDPYNVYDTTITLAVTDVDSQAFQQVFDDEDTPIEYLTSKIIVQYQAVWNNQDLPSALGLSAYADTDDKYVRELISVYPGVEGVLCIRALGSTQNDSEALAEAAYRLVGSLRDTVSAGSYRHDLSLMSRATKNVIDDSLRTAQEAVYDALDESRSNRTNAQLELKDLSAPSTGVPAVIKFAIAGAVVGMILAAVWIALKGIVGSGLLSSGQLERLGMTCLGSLAVPHGLFARWAARIGHERVWTDPAQAARYIAGRGEVSEKTVLLTSTLPLDGADPALTALREALLAAGAAAVRLAGDVRMDDAALSAVSGAETAILLERVGASDTGAVQSAAAYLEQSGCKVCGFALI